MNVKNGGDFVQINGPKSQKEHERLYVFKALLHAAEDIELGRLYQSDELDEIDIELDETMSRNIV